MKETNSEVIVAGFEQKIQELTIEISKISNSKALKLKRGGLANLESMLQKLTRELCDLIVAKQLQMALKEKEIQDESACLIKSLPQKMKNYGLRLTPVRMSNGTKVEVLAPYFARPCCEKKSEEWEYTQRLPCSVFSMHALLA